MVRVKIIKLPEYISEDDKYVKLGQIYEAFELGDEDCGDDFYKHFYGLNIGVGVFQISPENVEIIEEEPTVEVIADERVQKVLNGKTRILMVEDGSVDVDALDEWCEQNNIKLIVYRNGANPPAWLD